MQNKNVCFIIYLDLNVSCLLSTYFSRYFFIECITRQKFSLIVIMNPKVSGDLTILMVIKQLH